MFNTPSILPEVPFWTKPGNLSQNSVLTTIAATHADLALSQGVMTCTGGISIKISSITAWEVIPYAAGQTQTSSVNFTGIAVSDNTVYNLNIMTLLNNQVYTLQVISGTGATAASIVAQFAQAIANNSNLPITATAAGNFLILQEQNTWTEGFQVVGPVGSVAQVATTLTVTSITGTGVIGDTITQATSLATGLFFSQGTGVVTLYNTTGTFLVASDALSTTAGTGTFAAATVTVITSLANVQPSGIPAEVQIYAGAPVTGTYTLYAIQYNQSTPNSGISGNLSTPALAYIWANTGSANFSAFDTYLQNILNGTHTPASDYLGGA